MKCDIDEKMIKYYINMILYNNQQNTMNIKEIVILLNHIKIANIGS